MLSGTSLDVGVALMASGFILIWQGDMPDDDYQKFICVENGQTEQIPIAAGGSWQSSVTITAGGMGPHGAQRGCEHEPRCEWKRRWPAILGRMTMHNVIANVIHLPGFSGNSVSHLSISQQVWLLFQLRALCSGCRQ